MFKTTSEEMEKRKPYKPPSEFKQQYMKMQRQFSQAVSQFSLLLQGDRVLVAMSGGKDSYTLLHLLVDFTRRSPVKVQLFPVTVSTGFGDFLEKTRTIAQFVYQQYGLELHVVEEDFNAIIDEYRTENTSSCSFCARLRRGTLQTYCVKHEINKIALGHHADDVVESFLMSQLLNGKLWTQAPIYVSNKQIQVIRPLFFIFEQQIVDFKAVVQFPTVGCSCPHENNPQHFRAVSKRVLTQLQGLAPDCKNSLIRCCVECVQKAMRKDEPKEELM